jgi:hypothetical protein
VTSTDVKHTIAGFYYQVLLACKELTVMLNQARTENSYVAIEYGADVRIYDEHDVRMEAKFYNDSTFTRHKEAITHSIYNFFISFKGTGTQAKYRFKSNVPVHSKDLQFYREWYNPQKSADYIRYIKECFVYESVGRDPIKGGEFKKFQEDYKIRNPGKKKPKYKQELLKLLQANHSEYNQYILPTLVFDDQELIEFAQTVEFEFPDVKITKYESIRQLKECIDDALKKYDSSLTSEERKKIVLLTLEAFLDTTVDPNLKILKTADLQTIVQEHKTRQPQHFNKPDIVTLTQEIEQELEEYEYTLISNGYSEYVDDIMPILISLKEQLNSEMESYGISQVLGRFVMSTRDYPLEVTRLFESISEMMVKTNRVTDKANVVGVESFNNIKLGESLDLSIRAVPAASSSRNSPSLLLNKFIDHTLQNKEISKANGGETVVFDTDTDICEFDLSRISDIVINISKVRGNSEYHEFYQSFRYKCNKCFRLSYTGQCPFINELQGD